MNRTRKRGLPQRKLRHPPHRRFAWQARGEPDRRFVRTLIPVSLSTLPKQREQACACRSFRFARRSGSH